MQQQTETVEEYVRRGGLIQRIGPSVHIYTEDQLYNIIRNEYPAYKKRLERQAWRETERE